MEEYGKFKAKRTFYSGIWFDSMLESRVAEALDDLGIGWEFHTSALRDKSFPYGRYTPDFMLKDGRIVEVAGVFDPRHDRNTRVLAHILKSNINAPTVLVIDGDGNTTEWYCYTQNGVEYTGNRVGQPWNGLTNIFDAANKA
jgi:hypothetical protein